jgi:hypothetical protein
MGANMAQGVQLCNVSGAVKSARFCIYGLAKRLKLTLDIFLFMLCSY